MAFPSRFVDELVARSDIVDVVSDYLPLTQKGGSYWGLCPFHGEKTASFHVAPDRQIYHCFGCGKGGGVISFVMEIENLPYPDAVRLLAKKAGMEVPEEEGDDHFRQRRERLLRLNKESARFFHTCLHGPEGDAGLRYLRTRELSATTMTKFGLGYAPEGWDKLIAAMEQKGYDKRDLLDAGLAVSGQGGKIYDRFRNRVMFPIIDLRADVIGFGGRVLDDSTPKYLNSPDTVVFNKSRNLFALNLAKNTKQGKIVLTEGYMDTIALYQAGFDCAVASLGTSLTQDHARLLARFTKEVVIAYDADMAGVNAAKRAIPMLEKTGLKVKVLRMKGAKDPDEYIRKNGRESFAKLLEQSENHMEYLLQQIENKYALEDDAQKVEFARETAQLIAGLTSPVEREVYAGRVAETAGVAKAAMDQEIKLAAEQKLRQEKKKQERKDLLPVNQAQPRVREMRYENIRSARAEEGILRLLILDEALFAETEDLLPASFSSATLGKIYGVLRNRWQQKRPIQLGTLSDELTEPEVELLAEILQQPESLSNCVNALRDYKTILETEHMKEAGKDDETSLLAAREKYREKKSMGDNKYGR